MECSSFEVKYVGNVAITFCIRLNNHKKNVKNPKSISTDDHFRKARHSFNLHTNFT